MSTGSTDISYFFCTVQKFTLCDKRNTDEKLEQDCWLGGGSENLLLSTLPDFPINQFAWTAMVMILFFG